MRFVGKEWDWIFSSGIEREKVGCHPDSRMACFNVQQAQGLLGAGTEVFVFRIWNIPSTPQPLSMVEQAFIGAPKNAYVFCTIYNFSILVSSIGVLLYHRKGHIEICVWLAVTCGLTICRGPQVSHRYLKGISGVADVMQIFKKIGVNAIIDCRPTIVM